MSAPKKINHILDGCQTNFISKINFTFVKNVQKLYIGILKYLRW